jgi:hypothetical protein
MRTEIGIAKSMKTAIDHFENGLLPLKDFITIMDRLNNRLQLQPYFNTIGNEELDMTGATPFVLTYLE